MVPHRYGKSAAHANSYGRDRVPVESCSMFFSLLDTRCEHELSISSCACMLYVLRYTTRILENLHKLNTVFERDIVEESGEKCIRMLEQLFKELKSLKSADCQHTLQQLFSFLLSNFVSDLSTRFGLSIA